MKKYEAMFIIKPDSTEEDRKVLLSQINDTITKHGGTITQASIWAERRKLFFPLKRYHEGTYYLVNFDTLPASISPIQHAYRLNENILRVLITVPSGGKNNG